MKTVWTKTTWKKADLDHKLVEFNIPSGNHWIRGIGEFWVRQNPAGLLAIDIVVEMPKGWVETVQYRFYIPQVGVDVIEKHETSAVAQFRLFYRP